MRSFILALTIALTSCATPSPTPDPPPGPDIYGAACANLAAVGCPEGSRDNCAEVMQQAQEAHLTDLHPTCLAAAKTQDAARACGSVRCR
jgi:hypothetical protein